MIEKIVTYGQTAYEAYCAASDGKSLVSGEPLPAWDALPEPIASAWNRSGAAVCDDIIGDGLPGSEIAEVGRLRELITGTRERLENLAAGLELSAAATSPSKKSEIERECAEAVRGIAAGLDGA